MVLGALTVIHFPTVAQPWARHQNTASLTLNTVSASEFSQSPLQAAAKHLTKLGHIDTEVRGIQKYFH